VKQHVKSSFLTDQSTIEIYHTTTEHNAGYNGEVRNVTWMKYKPLSSDTI